MFCSVSSPQPEKVIVAPSSTSNGQAPAAACVAASVAVVSVAGASVAVPSVGASVAIMVGSCAGGCSAGASVSAGPQAAKSITAIQISANTFESDFISFSFSKVLTVKYL